MGKPQKNKRMAQVENSEEPANLRRSAPSQSIASDRKIKTDDEDSLPTLTAIDAAGYVHEMAFELKGIAESAKLSFLAYLLDLVIEESGVQKRGRL